MSSEVVQLNPPRPADPRDATLVDLARELNTERRAGNALLAALKELDAKLGEERSNVLGIEARHAELAEAHASRGAELVRQQQVNYRLYANIRNIGNALALERNKPLWRRLLNR